jgi:hypothetical protein
MEMFVPSVVVSSSCKQLVKLLKFVMFYPSHILMAIVTASLHHGFAVPHKAMILHLLVLHKSSLCLRCKLLLHASAFLLLRLRTCL